jgi:hypothetical protein
MRIPKRPTPNQIRQRTLFSAKGQISAMSSICNGLMWNVVLTPGKIALASYELQDVLKMFNKEVGWKKEEGQDGLRY